MVDAVAVTVTDITDCKQREADSQKMIAEWQAAFDAVRDVVLILDRDMRIVRANCAAAKFLGTSPDQLAGQLCHSVTHETCEPSERCPCVKSVELGRRVESEIYDGQRDAWFTLSVDPVFDEQGELRQFVYARKDITEKKRNQRALEDAYCQIQQLTERLEQENQYLRHEIQPKRSLGGIVCESPALAAVLQQVERVATTSSTVLISGETGTGKELIASAIHEQSSRCGRVMYRINCAALAPTLIESELFGREKGAYTGALTKQMGRFELADGSTLFLDEVGELPLELQAKLLRVLQEGTFERLGNPETVHVDVRIIAATNRDLAQATREGKFREDLFYRLNVFPIHVPPLRERLEAIPALVWSLIDEFSRAMGKTIESVPRRTMEALQHYSWPGNIRELRNVIERSMIMCDGPVLHIELPASAAHPATREMTLAELERDYIVEVLAQTRGQIRGPRGAAERLGLKPTTLESRMLKLGIPRHADQQNPERAP
jgi:PAS domain S-box-containing protein